MADQQPAFREDRERLNTLILRNLHWSQALFAMDPGVLLRVRMAPAALAPVDDPVVESIARMPRLRHPTRSCVEIFEIGEGFWNNLEVED